MNTQSTFRYAGIAGILMLAFTFTNDPAGGLSPVWSLISAVVGIALVAGLYLLYCEEASALSVAASAITVIGHVLFVVASWMQAAYPSPVLVAADIAIYILGLSLFSWLAYRTQKMPRILAIIGFLTALAGLGGYLVMWTSGASVTNLENAPPALMALFFAYLIGVVVWLAWTGIVLLRRQDAQPVAA